MKPKKYKAPLTFGQALLRFAVAAVVTFIVVFACGVGVYQFTAKYSKPVPGISPSISNR